MSRIVALSAFCLALLVVVYVLPAGAAGEDEPRLVHVVNFPERQRVKGEVAIEGTIRQADLVSFLEVELPPVRTDDPRRMVNAGTLTSDGFAAVVLSLSGTTKGGPHHQGDVGAILVPEEEAIIRILDERGQVQFPIEVSAPVAVGAAYFASSQTRAVLGFPRYRLLLYNTSDRTVVVDLYAYLTM